MNDKTTEQIAAEAAEKAYDAIQDGTDSRSTLEILNEHFQAAIEKAVKKNDDSWFAHKQGKHIPEYLRAAHASEPWKYDIDGTDGYIRIHPMHNPEITLFWITELAQAKKCVNAHNQCRAAHASKRWTRPSDETCAIYEGNRYIGEGK